MVDIMKVSCIVPTFNNSEDQIKSAIISIINSKFLIWEIVVIDDGSDSNSAETITLGLSQLYPSIRFIFAKQPNKGPSAARNYGVSLSTGNWLAFLDADDLMLPNGVLAKVDVINNSESMSLACVFSSFVWSDSGRIQNFKSVGLPIHPDEVGVLGKAPGGLPSYLIKRDVYLDLGGLDESLSYNEDFDLILRIIAKGYEVKGCAVAGFRRSVNPGSLTRSNMQASLAGGRLCLRRGWRERLLSKKEVVFRYSLNLAVSAKLLVTHFVKRSL